MYLLAMVGQLSQWQTIGAIVIFLGIIIFLVLRALRSSARNEEYIGSKSNRPSRDAQQKITSHPSIVRVILGIFAVSLIIYTIIGAFIPEKLLDPIKNKIISQHPFVYTFIGKTREMPATKTVKGKQSALRLYYHLNYQLGLNASVWFFEDSVLAIQKKKAEIDKLMAALDLQYASSIFNELFERQPIKNVTLNFLEIGKDESFTHEIMNQTNASILLPSYTLEDGKGHKTGGMSVPIEVVPGGGIKINVDNMTSESSVQTSNSYSIKIPMTQQTTTSRSTYSFSRTNIYSCSVSADISSETSNEQMKIIADCDFTYEISAEKDMPEGKHSLNSIVEQCEAEALKAVINAIKNQEENIAVTIAYSNLEAFSPEKQLFLQTSQIKHISNTELAKVLFLEVKKNLSNTSEVKLISMNIHYRKLSGEMILTDN